MDIHFNCVKRFWEKFLSYSNEIKGSEFREGLKITYRGEKEKNGKVKNVNLKPSIADALQILTIVYNMGHFYNTFVAPKAVIMYAAESNEFKKQVMEACEDPRYRVVAEEILETKNYQRLHLLNSLQILERCDREKPSVVLAMEIIYAYLGEKEYAEDSKLHYIFQLFRKVREVAYIAYDLQIARLPLNIDVVNEENIETLFWELLAKHNDNSATMGMMKAISKLLDDNVYYREEKVICYHRMSCNMLKQLREEEQRYALLWQEKNSILNRKCFMPRGKEKEQRLKMTFKKEERKTAYRLLNVLERTHGVRVGYYDRYGGEITLVVAMKEQWEDSVGTAFRVLRIVVKMLREIPEISKEDRRFLLAAILLILPYEGTTGGIKANHT